MTLSGVAVSLVAGTRPDHNPASRAPGVAGAAEAGYDIEETRRRGLDDPRSVRPASVESVRLEPAERTSRPLLAQLWSEGEPVVEGRPVYIELSILRSRMAHRAALARAEAREPGHSCDPGADGGTEAPIGGCQICISGVSGGDARGVQR